MGAVLLSDVAGFRVAERPFLAAGAAALKADKFRRDTRKVYQYIGFFAGAAFTGAAVVFVEAAARVDGFSTSSSALRLMGRALASGAVGLSVLATGSLDPAPLTVESGARFIDQ